MSTYSTSITNGITLTNFASQNPVTITHTGTLAPPSANAMGVHGTGPLGIYDRNTAATVVNAGIISGNPTADAGIILVVGGSVTNQMSRRKFSQHQGWFERRAPSRAGRCVPGFHRPNVGGVRLRAADRHWAGPGGGAGFSGGVRSTGAPHRSSHAVSRSA